MTVLKVSRSRAAACSAAMLIVTACKAPEQAPAPAHSATETPAAPTATPSTITPSTPTAPKPTSVIWDEPRRWVRKSSASPMRLATYTVPKATKDPEDAEVAVFYFGPGSGGDVESNIERWTSQFTDVAKQKIHRADRKVNGLAQHLVEIESGTYSSGMPGGPRTPKKEYGLIAAVVESTAGNYFFKMTGPTATVKNARGEMYTLLGTTRPNPH